MSSRRASFGIVPLAILAVGILLAASLLAVQRSRRAEFAERQQAVAVARAIIERGGAAGTPRRRLLLETLAADGESLAELDLRDAKLARIDLSGAVLDFAKLGGADLAASKLPLVSGVGASLRGADLTRVNAVGVDFTGADLSNVALGGSALQRADFTQAKLWNAKLPGARLAHARFVRAQLAGADLSGADLESAQLFESDLFEANLQGASLRGAQLGSARLKHANLTGADLREAPPAQLSAAELRSSCMDPATTLLPEGFVFDAQRYRPTDRCCELWPLAFVRDATAGCAPAAAGEGHIMP